MKAIRYSIIIVLVIIIAWESVYIKKLDEVKAARSAKTFNASAYAEKFWKEKLVPNLDKAITLDTLVDLLRKDTVKTFDAYSHALGIGNLRYFLVKGKGTITSINEDDIQVTTQPSNIPFTLATEYIFGNAVRDASGYIDINEFSNTMDFNNVSAELNKLVRQKVLAPFKANMKKGKTMEFVGAIELNREHPDLDHIEVIPVKLSLRE